MVSDPFSEILVRDFSELLDQIDQKLETIGVYSSDLRLEHFLICLQQFVVHKLHLFLPQTRNIREVIDVAVIASRRLQIEGYFSQKQLDPHQVLVLYAQQ